MQLISTLLSFIFATEVENVTSCLYTAPKKLYETILDTYICDTYTFSKRLLSEIDIYNVLSSNIIEFHEKEAKETCIIKKEQLRELKGHLRLKYLQIQQLICKIFKNLFVLNKIDSDTWNGFFNTVFKYIDTETPEDIIDVFYTDLYQTIKNLIVLLKSKSDLIKYKEKIYELEVSILGEKKNIEEQNKLNNRIKEKEKSRKIREGLLLLEKCV